MRNRYGKPVSFIHFPGKKRQAAAANRWINACRRPAHQLSLKNLTYHHYICSLHWVGEDGPTNNNQFPLPADMSEKERNRIELAFQKRLGLRGTDSPRDDCDQFEGEDTRMPDPSESSNSRTAKAESFPGIAETLVVSGADNGCDFVVEQELPNSEDFQSEYFNFNSNNNDDSISEAENGCDFVEQKLPKSEDLPVCSYASTSTQTQDLKSFCRTQFINQVLADPMYYTGVNSKELLHFIFDLVKEKASKMTLWRGGTETLERQDHALTRKLSTWEEYLLTLFRIRRGINIKMTAHLFGISVGLASNIFVTWTLLLEKELLFLRRFASAECNEKSIPLSMRKKNGEPKPFVKGLRSIIDAVEFRCEAPTLPAAQKRLYSGYYNDNTFKLLIGCTPNGYINYTSDLWSGNVSDKRLVQKSGFLDCLRPGDNVMADKGFRIRGLLALKQCRLILPPALKGGKLKPRGSTMARKVSNVRIHIERAIRRLKTFRILSRQLKMTQKFHINSIVKVCVSLANLGGDLVT